ncbi:AMP-binding protein [Micromonospora sp. WMMD1120]|uniref:AMP-binding protein n=1 Tax=Micromonospora sp. WMMD1120 TaxID=3016106 RepID=UPI002417A8D5|nr:AMP-binding protein [Micromonospora sp. WMMD1120]MDG4809338.1 AMP-binding protein [Micromonospora sp. WMMD1120]
MRWLERALLRRDSDAPLIEVMGRADVVTYRSAFDAAAALAAELTAVGNRRRRVGLVAHNSPHWVVADLACMIGGAVEVPVPLAFSADQARSLLREVDLCLVDAAGRERLEAWGDGVLPPGTQVSDIDLADLCARGRGRVISPPPGDWACKIIHTSGTTSAPKGVRIRASGLDEVLESLDRRIPAAVDRRYLSVVPLSLLIEQISGTYLTMLGGGTLVLLPAEVPLLGTAPGALAAVTARVPEARVTAMQGPPALFEAFAQIAVANPTDDPQALARRLFGTSTAAFLACGGAPISRRVLDLLARRGVPVFEGYGLSENTSVVSWNDPSAPRPGSVGRPLDHVEVRIAADAEILVRSPSVFAGYTVDDPSSCEVDAEGWLHTGDLGDLDADGYLYVRGRKKNIVITAAGRNVAADWVASRYREVPGVLAAVVFGDGLDELTGFFVTAEDAKPDEIRSAILAFGDAALSEVERVRIVHLVSVEDPRLAGLFTVTGRPVRDRIWQLITESATHSEEKTVGRTIAPFGAYAGRLITGSSGEQLDDVDPREAVALLADAGFLVLRGFDADIDRFNGFVRKLSSQVVADPAREFVGEAAQKVDAGLLPVGLHLENGNSPFRPDLTWFFCQRAAGAGSQTTVCDGYEVWESLPATSRAAWTAQDIVYSRNVSERAWKGLALYLLNGAKGYDDVTLDDLRAFIREPDRTEVRDNGDGSVYYAHREPAVRNPTLLGGRPAWANSIFGPSYNYEQPVITFADGSDIPQALLDEAAKVTEAVTEEVDWQDGDVVVIDNSRVMHGRREILDPRRVVLNAQSYLNEEYLPGAGA